MFTTRIWEVNGLHELLIRSGCGSKVRSTGFESRPRRDICHCGRAYTVFQSHQRSAVCGDIYGTVHRKEPKRVGHSPDFGLPSVAILQ